MTHSSVFKLITQSIPALTEGLKMIWVLSNYYSAEEKMMELLERISWQLCQNVTQNVAIENLFK